MIVRVEVVAVELMVYTPPVVMGVSEPDFHQVKVSPPPFAVTLIVEILLPSQAAGGGVSDGSMVMAGDVLMLNVVVLPVKLTEQLFALAMLLAVTVTVPAAVKRADGTVKEPIPPVTVMDAVWLDMATGADNEYVMV